MAKSVLPPEARQWLRAKRKALARRRPFGVGRDALLASAEPVSRRFGFDRGTPVDRYYIERFLAAHAQAVRGRVLEVGDDTYARRYGAGRVRHVDVLHVEPGHPGITIVADIAAAGGIDSETFDCIIFTQTLQFVYDPVSAVSHLHRILRPDGVLLATVPGISPISRHDMDRWGEYWRFTSRGVLRLLDAAFGKDQLDVQACGNLLAATAFLHGLAAEELTPEELDRIDPDYELLVTAKARR